MGKILGRGGESLAPTYEVEGSVVAVEELASREVHLVDTMGQRMHSERLCTVILKVETAEIAVSTAFNSTFPVLPDAPHRVTNVSVITKSTGNAAAVAVLIRDPTNGREIPIFVWDETNDVTTVIRWDNDGAGVTSDNFLAQTRPALGNLNMLTRIGTEAQSGVMPELVLRGSTNAVAVETFISLVQVIRPMSVTPAPGEAPAHGLPIPSW